MRRRLDESVPPADLIVFDGRRYKTASEWEAAFATFHRARERWATRRGMTEAALPDWRVDGDCPWDPDAI